ncbi:hypothetical protein MNV49_000467 [Pseudohyphozyma bogoriensis]|nr:hypothetical protein MNV49_000467 [Pseudohyphozyma bogoriensis]
MSQSSIPVDPAVQAAEPVEAPAPPPSQPPPPAQQHAQPPPIQLPSLKDWAIPNSDSHVIPPPSLPPPPSADQDAVSAVGGVAANAFLPGPDGTPAVKEDDVEREVKNEGQQQQQQTHAQPLEHHYPYTLGAGTAPSYSSATSYGYQLPSHASYPPPGSRPTPPPGSFYPPPSQPSRAYASHLPPLSQPQSPSSQYRSPAYHGQGGGPGSGHATPNYGGYDVDSRGWSTGYGTPVEVGQKRERSWDEGRENDYEDEEVHRQLVQGVQAGVGGDDDKKGKKKKVDGGDLNVANGGTGKAPPVKKFVCPHASCGRAFARNFNLQSHIKSHLVNCPECPKAFSRRHDCARHCIAVHHYDKETGKPKVQPAPASTAAAQAQQQDQQTQHAVQQSIGQIPGLEGAQWNVNIGVGMAGDDGVGALGLPGLGGHQ